MNDSVKIFPDCIIGFAHQPKKGPSWAVDDRAGLKLLLYRQGRPDVPAILSAGIARYFSTSEVANGVVVHGGEPPSIPITSYEAWFVMQEKGWKTCVVLAYKDDVARCTAEMTARGATVVGTIPVEINSQ